MKKDNFEITKLFAVLFGWFFSVIILVITGICLKDIPDTETLRLLLALVISHMTLVNFLYLGHIAMKISKG